jgi:hypothetical protein
MGAMIKAIIKLVAKSRGKKQYGIPWGKWEDNIKVYIPKT